jgi:Uma2 family endonuclease
MTQAIPKLVNFDQFIEWYPENSLNRYELHEGIIVEMPKPKGKHSEVAGLTSGELFLEIRRLQLPYFLPKECILTYLLFLKERGFLNVSWGCATEVV